MVVIYESRSIAIIDVTSETNGVGLRPGNSLIRLRVPGSWKSLVTSICRASFRHRKLLGPDVFVDPRRAGQSLCGPNRWWFGNFRASSAGAHLRLQSVKLVLELLDVGFGALMPELIHFLLRLLVDEYPVGVVADM